MNIAAGYKRGELKQWFEENPDTQIDAAARIQAVRDWIGHRYCGWLSNQEINDYTIYDVTTDGFRIDFTHDTDAQLFTKQVGGRVLEE